MRLSYLLFLSFFSLKSFTQNLNSGGRLKPEQAIMDIRHYTVALDVDPVEKTINGYTDIELILSKPTTILLFDLVHLYKVEQVLINGKVEPFKHDSDLLFINPVKELAAGRLSVKVKYGGHPGVASRPPWDGGFTWAKDKNNNPWIAITDEGEGSKILFPSKDHPSDEPNEGADLIITVPKGLVVAGPGSLINVKVKSNKATYHWKTNYTINNYCILFNIGKYKVVKRLYKTVNGNTVPIEFYVLEEDVLMADHHLDVLERSIRVQEKYFGEYPFVKEKIGICETPHLGMEHQTMNAYGNSFKYKKVGGQDFDWLMHHEFGHEWWGNKITAKDWGHYWIQEGICVFGDALFVREMEGEESYLKRMRTTALSLQNKKAVVLGDEVTEDEAYHPDIYGKGAFFMHTLRYVIGDDIFFPALKSFATDKRYTYDNLVTTTDVEQYFSKASEMNLKPLFDFYLRTVQKLEINIRQLDDTSYSIKLLNLDMPLPMDIATDKDSKRMLIDNKGVVVKSKTVPRVDEKVYYLKKLIIE
ncbi:MAG: M1 family metallopeptidase [Ferruginibacter sp.]